MNITTRIKNSVGGQGALGSAEYVGEGVASLVAIPRAHRRGSEVGAATPPGGRASPLRHAPVANHRTSIVYVRPTKGATRLTASSFRADESANPSSCFNSRKQTSMAH